MRGLTRLFSFLFIATLFIPSTCANNIVPGSSEAPETAMALPSQSVQQKILFGQVEFDTSAEPDVDEFKLEVRKDPSISCAVKTALPRLFRVAHNEQMRMLVWKRMQRQELALVDDKTLSHIEELAASCRMPLIR